MRIVFADTVYWIALANPRDPWRAVALAARHDIGSAVIVTSDDVLAEFLTALGAGGSRLRETAARMVRVILTHDDVRVVPQSRESFLRGLERYTARPDKGYSLADCTSMNTMDTEGIREILTHDHHFAQEGFTVLMRR